MRLAVALLILKTTLVVVLNYGNYFPPNFGSDFLRGREREFSGPYRWAFYTHITFGPVALLLAMILIAEPFRRRFPRGHRQLGRIQVPCVLFLVAPSGLVMAFSSRTGAIGIAGLALLAVATATSAGLGWRAASRRRFADHRRWMCRTSLLLGSAVVLRVAGGLASVVGANPDWADPLAIWLSWLVPITAFEAVERARG